jgi:acyl-CoA dehydrogenase
MALGAVGAMHVALERTIAYTRERQAFGRPLTGHQAVRHRLVELATTAHTCRCVTYDALRRFAAGEDAVREVTMAKLATQRASFELHDALLSLLGPDPELERAARDSRLGPIGGGTDEIMKEILSRTLLP